MRFAFSFPQVQATVGSASRQANLDAFLRAVTSRLPVQALAQGDCRGAGAAAVRRWSDETDIRAQPWTM